MKTFENPFSVVVELRNIGDCVASAKVSMSMRFDRVDFEFISGCILDRLLPDWAVFNRLYDGSYVLTSADDSRFASCQCVPYGSRSFPGFDASVELDDGLIHSVHIFLDQRDGLRDDFNRMDSRYIRLRGKVVVEIEDDEALEA